MIIVGIDPGLDGAIAFYNTRTRHIVDIISMPTVTLAKGKGSKREISWSTLCLYIKVVNQKLPQPVDEALIERVSSSPQMGVTSAFNFGRTYGGLECLLAALSWRHEFVTPAKWKKTLNVPADKDDARHRANQLMPTSTEHWAPERSVMTTAQAGGRAEAALLCKYGELQLIECGEIEERPRRRRVLSEANA